MLMFIVSNSSQLSRACQHSGKVKQKTTGLPMCAESKCHWEVGAWKNSEDYMSPRVQRWSILMMLTLAFNILSLFFEFYICF